MKRILILLLMHCALFSMNDDMPALIDSVANPNPTLMRAISASNHAAVLSALRNNQDQNYLWKAADGAQHKAYVDLTAAMYALKILRKNNRWECASNLAIALTWDLGNAAMGYLMGAYDASQYPIVNSIFSYVEPIRQYVAPMRPYIDPVRQSHTAALLFNLQNQDHQQIVNTYKPAKRIARDLLIKENTNLTVARLAQWDDHPVTVETYLNNMLHSWNPVTRKDGQDLSIELGQVLRERQGINEGDEGFTRREQEITMMGFGGDNRRQRRGILVLNNERF